jgi:hypothetical protein
MTLARIDTPDVGVVVPERDRLVHVLVAAAPVVVEGAVVDVRPEAARPDQDAASAKEAEVAPGHLDVPGGDHAGGLAGPRGGEVEVVVAVAEKGDVEDPHPVARDQQRCPHDGAERDLGAQCHVRNGELEKADVAEIRGR